MLKVEQIEFGEACAFVRDRHPEYELPEGILYSLAVVVDNRVVGVVIVGDAIGDDGSTLEVRCVCTDGTSGAGNLLLAASWEVAKGLGYRRLIMYRDKDRVVGVGCG